MPLTFSVIVEEKLSLFHPVLKKSKNIVFWVPILRQFASSKKSKNEL